MSQAGAVDAASAVSCAAADCSQLGATTLKLLQYCKSNNWSGYDPYDALNSPLLRVPLFDTKIPRLVLTQLLKRSPVNFRRLLLVSRTQNPKSLGLFLAALPKLSNSGLVADDALIAELVERIIALRSPGTPYWCWGYSFPWQTRTIVVPAGAPNLVCTVFVAGALLDAYERLHDRHCLEIAASAARYIADELFWDDGKSACGFSYPMRSLQSRTHNANFLAAALLCRVYKHTSEETLLGPALRAARYSAGKQHSDGSWYYGEGESQRWIDNFHTGYNLGALRAIEKYASTTEFDERIRRGFAFYRTHFFREDAAPRYFHDRTYPIDVHCVAQSILTLLQFQDLDPGNRELAWAVYDWAMRHMWDARGFFYYRVQRLWTVRTSYIRWSQAWMLLALATLVCETRAPSGSRQGGHSAPSLVTS